MALSEIIADNPTKEADLRSYVTHCKNLRGSERNRDLYTTQVLEAEDIILDLEAARDNAQAQLDAENLKTNPDAGVQAQLAADIALYAGSNHGFDAEIEGEGPAFGGKRIGCRCHHDQAAAGVGANSDQVMRLVVGLQFNARTLVTAGFPDKTDF